MNAIELHNVTRRFGHLTALRGVTLSIPEGQTFALFGPNGAGKSTLLRILAGLDAPNTGRVILNNQNIYDLSDDERASIRSQTFGFIFQSFRLFPALTVLENVALSLDIKGDPNSQNTAMEWLHEVGLSDRMDHLPDILSGGEQQRVAIARALATQPKIIIADEPTGNLDQKNSDALQTLLTTCIEKSNASLVLVTHDTQLATLCDTRYELFNGQLKK